MIQNHECVLLFFVVPWNGCKAGLAVAAEDATLIGSWPVHTGLRGRHGTSPLPQYGTFGPTA
ncbi:MAG: hypothetical protein D6741_04780 [Planctomycetota bacterium]|nr:MAG: hypothetical protein D6741_04780 [Planctomycetota bacterium]